MKHGKNSFQFKLARRFYRKVLILSKSIFLKNKCKQSFDLESSNPREHWKLFRFGFHQNQECVISLKQWYDHFEELFSFKLVTESLMVLMDL